MITSIVERMNIMDNMTEKFTVDLICHYLTDITKTKMLCCSVFVSDPVMKHETHDIPFSISFN